jgi:hypothetical protein
MDYKIPESTTSGLKLIGGTVLLTSTPAIGACTGHGYIATRTGVGDYLITLQDVPVQAIVFAQVSYHEPGGAGASAVTHIGAVDPVAGTIQVLNANLAGVATEIAADDGFSFLIGVQR